MGLVRYLAGILFIIALPVALITTTVRVVVNEPRLYEYAADRYDTPEVTGIARSELLSASGELRDYFNNDEEEIFVRVEKDGQPIRLFSERETAHLRDVKNLMQGSFRVQEMSVVFVLVYVVGVFIWAKEGSLRVLAKQLLISGALSLALVGLVGVAVAVGFDQTFEQFHVIAFDNDLWLLDPKRDHLIQMFPEAFWRDVIVAVGVATFVEIAVLSGISALYLWRTREESVEFALAAGAQA